MANLNQAFGARPVFHLAGGVIRPQKYTIASALNNAIGFGDFVKMVGTGKNIDAVDAAADAPIVGVFAGCTYQDSTGSVIWSKNWVAATATLGSVDATAYVYDDPFIVYEIQADEDVVAGDIGQDADIVYAEPNSTTGISKTMLDSSDIGTGDNLHIYDIVPRDDNIAGSNYTKVWVLINEHSLRNGGAVSFLEV